MHSMLPVNLNELLLCFLSDYYNTMLENGPYVLKHTYHSGIQNKAINCPGSLCSVSKHQSLQT